MLPLISINMDVQMRFFQAKDQDSLMGNLVFKRA